MSKYKKYEDKFNIMIIGDEKVGKTVILERFFHKIFITERKKTMGIEHYDKVVIIDDKEFLFKIWDTAGQEKFKVMSRSYYQMAHGMILACALNNRDSFYNLRVWFDTFKESVGEDNNIQIVIIANKSDLIDEKNITEEELKKKADEIGVEYFLTSAKTGENVEEAFDKIFKKVYGSVYNKNGFLLDDKTRTRDTSNCC
jgi:small GTP-binding protein